MLWITHLYAVARTAPASLHRKSVPGRGNTRIDGQTVAVSYHGLRPSTRESRNYLLFELRGGPAGPCSGIGSYLETGVRQLLVVEES